jgi:hypothetical protein
MGTYLSAVERVHASWLVVVCLDFPIFTAFVCCCGLISVSVCILLFFFIPLGHTYDMDPKSRTGLPASVHRTS